MPVFPVGSVIEIIIAAALIIIAFKIIKSIAKPIVYGILIVAALLLIFGVVDIAAVQSKGEKIAGDAISCAEKKAKEAAAEAIKEKTDELLGLDDNAD